MLALRRRVGQSIVIGEGPDAVELTVVEIRGGSVQLSFDAPDGITIDRSEVRDRKDQEEDAK
jgi:carbon storage regulator